MYKQWIPLGVVFALACAPKNPGLTGKCVTSLAPGTAPASGSTLVFDPDPATAHGVFGVSPTSSALDAYRDSRTLLRLNGTGVLDGEHLEVRSGNCDGDFGALSRSSSFEYRREEDGFAEAMTYYHGDTYLAYARARGLELGGKLFAVAHCPEPDNAFFVKGFTTDGSLVRLVCFGDSTQSVGASYAEDGQVAVHEIQHGLTSELYSPTVSLNQLWYDDAGSLNEGISDFFALAYSDPQVAAAQDPKIFGRWSLGLFTPRFDGTRGAHRCPRYDPSFPNCGGYALGGEGFSESAGRVSYSYPDGMGWRYGRSDTSRVLTMREIYQAENSREQIHTNAVLASGLLWDAYSSIKGVSGQARAGVIMMDLVHEALRHLPKPSSSSVSPVTYVGFASALRTWAPVVGFSDGERQLLDQALNQRGFSSESTLPASWASVGPGVAPHSGLYVEDDYRQLRSWATGRGIDRAVIPQGIETGLNRRADPGEVVVLWFDIRNNADLTAGSVELDVSSENPAIEFFDARLNDGAMSVRRAQVRYQKINGTQIASRLSGLGLTNSYFGTNPRFTRGSITGVWVKVLPSATPGQVIPIQIRVTPANGPSQVLTFQLPIGQVGG